MRVTKPIFFSFAAKGGCKIIGVFYNKICRFGENPSNLWIGAAGGQRLLEHEHPRRRRRFDAADALENAMHALEADVLAGAEVVEQLPGHVLGVAADGGEEVLGDDRLGDLLRAGARFNLVFSNVLSLMSGSFLIRCRKMKQIFSKRCECSKMFRHI
jgi:hypothetical protein